MATARNGSYELHYDTFGDPADPAVLLVMGLGTQMIAWEPGFCELLVERGHFVIRFDNRDVGLSTKTDGPLPNVMAIMAAATSGGSIAEQVPYTLSDMAADGLAVLDACEVDRAHVVGASLGGMIVQQLAIEHPDRVRSMTSIMSTTGDPSVGQGKPEALVALASPPPTDREGFLKRSVDLARLISGPEFDPERSRARITDAFERSFHPQGSAFQIGAIAATGDRTAGLRALDVPTLVIHGAEDPLVGRSGGEATAEAVPGAELLIIDEMGHDLPPSVWPRITGAIADLAARAD